MTTMPDSRPRPRTASATSSPQAAPPGRARPLRLLREGVATALTQPVATAVAALITAAVCAAVFATTGQSAASEARVLAQVDQAGARTIVFSDPTGRAGLVAEGLDAVAALPGVQWVAALGPAVDVRNAALGEGGTPVASRALYTQLPPVVTITGGRAPRVGEAIASSAALRTLGMPQDAGGVAGDTYRGPVVGTFTAADPLTGLESGVLVRAQPGRNQPLRSVHVVAASINDVAVLERAVPSLLRMTDPVQLVTESPAVLVDLQRVVAGQLGANTRQLMLLVLGAGLVLVAVTLYGATATRRRDFGRRRALGASRTDIVVLVLTQTGVAAGAGALAGTGTGLGLVQALEGAQPGWRFTTGVAILAVLAALAAAVPPAVAAATRDPVRILRVP